MNKITYIGLIYGNISLSCPPSVDLYSYENHFAYSIRIFFFLRALHSVALHKYARKSLGDRNYQVSQRHHPNFRTDLLLRE